MAPAIQVQGLSKQYRLGQLGARYDTVRDALVRLARREGARTARETIWALRNVSFDVEQGEVVGIIGRNGAGKTTLLKLLSRITKPTRGRAEIFGRVGSLLEVGTGFHPELTGRENVFLNGAILGMRRAEVAGKLDDIVAFAGVEQFLDTPVKRYSSGMQVRLAFAVAAHLEPEILLVDEVLAVGDIEFQRRSLGKMEEIGQSGRTVFLVSHSMPTITRLCRRAILLDRGEVAADGDAIDVVAQYLSSERGSAADRRWEPDEAPGGELVRLRSVRVIDEAGASIAVVDVRAAVGIELVFDVLADGPPVVPWLALYDDYGAHVFSAMDTDESWTRSQPPGRYVSTAWVPPQLLNEGTVVVTPSILTFAPEKSVRHAQAANAVSFQVVDAGEGDTARGHYGGTWPGTVRPFLRWTTAVEAPADERVS